MANFFETARRGNLTDRQLRTLDSLRAQTDSDNFNGYREAVGVAPFFPNYKLSKKTAAALIRLILKTQQEGRANG